MNPLALFRKYQKTLLAVAAVGAMLAFGILPILSDWLGQSQRGGRGGDQVDGNAVAVSWTGGQFREGELYNQRLVRTQLRRFQSTVIQRSAERGGRPRSVVVPDTSSEASVVESVLLAQEAERQGVRIGDEAVLQYLTQHLADDTMDRNELARLLRDSTGGQLTQTQLFDGIRTEMAAYRMRILANGSAFNGNIADTAISPGQSYEYFKRLYRRMEAEVMPFAVEDFVDKVTEQPTSTEVAELYEEYKDTYPSPITPTPGFKEPMRVAFTWLKADYQTFLDRELKALTDEEIQTYYDENRESYKKISLPETGGFDLGPEVDTSPETSASPGEQPDASLPMNTESTDGEAKETAESAESTDPDAVDAGEGQDELGEQELVEQADEIVQQATDDAVEIADEVVVNEIESGAGADEVATEAEAGIVAEPEIVESELPTSDEVATPPVTGTQVVTEPEAEADPVVEPEVPEYQPLEEVRDDIANTLARPKATDAIKAAIDEVNGEMKSYFEDYMFWDTTPEGEKNDKPTPPDAKALAARLGMTTGEIPLITVFQAEEYELGRAFELDFSTGQIQRIPFTSMGFAPNLAMYDPQGISSADIDSQFIFWKTDMKEDFVPTLEEARPNIERHWKMKKAIDLARAEAQKVADSLNSGEQSLRTKFGEDSDKKITDTGQFTWMTFGATPTGQGPPRLSFVEGVDFPGEDFMRDISKLDAGGVTVTNNYPETEVYVVYMKGITGNDDDLRTLFLNEGVKQPVLFMARQDAMRAAADWYMAKEKEWGLDWERTPAADTR